MELVVTGIKIKNYIIIKEAITAHITIVGLTKWISNSKDNT